MKKLIASLLTFTMLFTMITSFCIVTTNAASESTHEVEKIIWVQDFEKNMSGDSEANWTSKNDPYDSNGRFAGSGSSGACYFVDGDNNYLVATSNRGVGTDYQVAAKIMLDNTKFEVGKKYKIVADVELHLNTQAEENDYRSIFAYVLSNTGTEPLNGKATKGLELLLKDNGKGIVSTKVFEYTQDIKDVLGTKGDQSPYGYYYYNCLNVRVECSTFQIQENEDGSITKDNFYVDNVRIVEVTEEENIQPECEGSVFDDYVLGATMDFENLSYNTLRHDTSTPGRDTDVNGIKRIVPDPVDPSNTVLRSHHVVGVTYFDSNGDLQNIGSTIARIELIDFLSNCNNRAGKTYTVSFKMYPYGLSNVPITVGFKKNINQTTYNGISKSADLVEGIDFTPNQWNNIQIDVTTVDADEINFSMHQRSINNGAEMDFFNYDYYEYIYIDDITITEKVEKVTNEVKETSYTDSKGKNTVTKRFFVALDSLDYAEAGFEIETFVDTVKHTWNIVLDKVYSLVNVNTLDYIVDEGNYILTGAIGDVPADYEGEFSVKAYTIDYEGNKTYLN